MPSAVPNEIFAAINGGPAPVALAKDEQQALEQLRFFFDKGLGYANEMRLRPQTLYALRTLPWGSPPGSSTTTRRVTPSPAFSTDRRRA